jgi:hypothetical protein
MATKTSRTVSASGFFQKIFVVTFFVTFMLAISSAVNAIQITLEPDDYGVGAPLENEYATTAWVDGPLKNQKWSSALLARDGREYDPGYSAPTGTLIFGAFPFIYDEHSPAASFGGLGIRFHQDVKRITLLANSIYPPGDLSAVWAAFDIDGNQIASGYAGGDRPATETFAIEIHSKGVRSLILGGDYATSAICFDHLTFEVDAAFLSEPGTMIIFIIGLAMLILRPKRKQRQSSYSRLALYSRFGRRFSFFSSYGDGLIRIDNILHIILPT